MSWFFNLLGKASGNVAEVTADNELQVALSTNNPGPVKLLDGNGEMLRVTDTGALLTSQREVALLEQVDGNALNTNRWATSVSGMAVAQASGFITVNSGAVTTASSYAILQSIRSIPLYGALPVLISIHAKVSVTSQLNATIEMGIGAVAATSAPTDGCYFRWTSAGDFRAVINNGGTETISPAITMPTINDSTLFEIELVEDAVAFIIDDVEVAAIQVPIALSYPTSSGRLPIFFRVYTGGSAPGAAPVLSMGQLTVVQQDVVQRRAWDTVLSSMGNGAYQLPVTTFGQTTNHANSTNPTSATLSNTAAGYTTLGGRFQFAAPAGAVTDFALFGFQVPANYQLFINRIAISTVNTGAAVGATATILDWAIGVNASNVSLATADGAGAWGPRRIPLGMQILAALGAIGVMPSDIQRNFDTPLVVDGGRFVHIIVQIPVGLATASQVIRGDVMIGGYFE